MKTTVFFSPADTPKDGTAEGAAKEYTFSVVKRKTKEKQGRIHDCPCRGRLGRGSNELGRGRNEMGRGINNHRILIPELF